MATPAYRQASRGTGWWLGICLIGVAAQVSVVIFLSTTGLMNRLGVWAVIPSVLPLLAAILIGWRVLAGCNRRRIEALVDRATALGFQLTRNPGETEKAAFATPLLHLFPTLELQQGPTRIQWFAVQSQSSPTTLLFEHEYVIGSGKFTQVRSHTILAWPAGHPEVADAGLAAAPWFLLARYPWLQRRAKEKESLQDPAFGDLAATWTFYGNAATGTRFLTSPVKLKLAHAPVGEEWSVGSGWVCCAFQGTLDAAGLAAFVRHARALIGAAPN